MACHSLNASLYIVTNNCSIKSSDPTFEIGHRSRRISAECEFKRDGGAPLRYIVYGSVLAFAHIPKDVDGSRKHGKV